MSLEKISIYVNKKFVMKIDISLSDSIQELRSRLEILIPNDLKFIKEEKIINKEQEKELIIKDIIDKDKSVYLKQDFFDIFLDNKIIKKKVDLFKLETAKTLIHHYKEYFPNKIYIKCEPDIFIEIGNSIDINIQINSLLSGNCIQAYSQLTKKKIKNNFEVKKYGYMIKENGNISFVNFNYNKLDIFETLLLDEKYEKNLEQSKNKTRKEEYKNLNETKNNIPLKVQLENIISQDNTNIDALFEYLMNLKENKDQEFKEKLKKYIFLLDINKIKILDTSFEGELYQNFFDEKTNLIKFLEKVIDEDYS